MKMFKFVMNYMAKKHFFSILVATLVMIVIYRYINNCGEYSQFVSNIIINVFSGWVAAIAAVLLILVEYFIKNRCEDSEKLTEDYKELVKKYSQDKENMDTYENFTGTTTFPIVLIGKVVDLPVTKDFVSIEDDSENVYQLPSIIKDHFNEIFAAHNTSIVYNNINIRILDMHIDETEYYLKTGRTTYFKSLLTNRAMDWKWAHTSVREMYEYGPKLNDLKDSVLSNHLGFNGFVESSDGKIVFVKRKGNLSIGKSTYGDSIGASLKAEYAINKEGNFTLDGMINAVTNEIY